MLKYEKLVLGDLATNCYIVWEQKSKEAAIIDPADAGVEIGDELQRLQLKPQVILATHGHFDHLLGALDLRLMFEIPLALSSKDMFLLNRQNETASHFLGYKVQTPNIKKIDLDLEKVDFIDLGDEKLAIIRTPGHTPGGLSFYSEPNKLLFSGDMVFEEGMIGSTSHKYSSKVEMKKSIDKITELPKDTLLLPGHGEELTIFQWMTEFGR